MSTPAVQVAGTGMSDKTADVLAGGRKWSYECGDALPWLRSLPDRAVSVFFTSPPYEGQRTYGVGFKLRGQNWVDWLRPFVVEMCRASAGLVLVNVASPVRKWAYSAAAEWLVADLTRLDGVVCGPSPYAWVKSADADDANPAGIPGSGSGHYHRRDWEAVYAFALPDRLPGGGRRFWSDNTAFGHPPVCPTPGGEFSNRNAAGVRANEKRDGWAVRTRPKTFTPPPLSNPGNVVRARAGGGHLGCKSAHRGEAPMPMALAERFVCWFCPPGGVVGDPFAGTGTTGHAAMHHGRRFVGCDLRESQAAVARERLARVTPALF